MRFFHPFGHSVWFTPCDQAYGGRNAFHVLGFFSAAFAEPMLSTRLHQNFKKGAEDQPRIAGCWRRCGLEIIQTRARHSNSEHLGQCLHTFALAFSLIRSLCCRKTVAAANVGMCRQASPPPQERSPPPSAANGTSRPSRVPSISYLVTASQKCHESVVFPRTRTTRSLPALMFPFP